MIVDNEWPDDWTGSTEGIPRYEDLATYAALKGHDISISAIGRFGMRMRTLARMKQAGVITREIMADLNDEKASQTQKAVAEMITAVTIEFVSDQENFEADQIRDVAKAMKDCTAIAIASDKHVRTQIEAKAQTAAEHTKSKLTEAGVDRKLIQEVIDEHLGVVAS